MAEAIVALGANVEGNFGGPVATFRHAVRQLADAGCTVRAVSGLYCTSPWGGSRQPHYLNAVLRVDVPLPPAELLRLFKRIERSAGRRKRSLNAPRPLDLDLIAVSGIVVAGRPRSLVRCAPAVRKAAPRPWLVLPHPELHRRRFVLVPLVEIAPYWVHPGLGLPAARLLSRLPARPHDVERVLDFAMAFVRHSKT